MNTEARQELPIGQQSFEALRKRNRLYVDKTGQLMKIADTMEYCFLSRPRRFGKSLMISTLEAMFQGKVELFRGLAAEDWVAERAKKPSPVLHFDMSSMYTLSSQGLEKSLYCSVMEQAESYSIILPNYISQAGDALKGLLKRLYDERGSVVVLIDEYDAPILDNITIPETVEEIRRTLHSFYRILKSSAQYLGFVMLTGISKFSKMSIFSAMNNLFDLSMNPTWGTLLGWTMEELEANLTPWLDDFAQAQNITRPEALQQMKDYYDGYSFDGEHHVYNPLSVMMCLKTQRLRDYWYETATPSYLVKSLKRFGMDKESRYESIVVDENFTSAQEIEHATPESFLYQSGYLTIKERKSEQFQMGASLTLDYPNWEVRQAIDKTCLEQIYGIRNYRAICDRLWPVINAGDVASIETLFNDALKTVDYESMGKISSFEAIYHALFRMFVEVAGVIAPSEPQNAKGRPDFAIIVNKFVYIVEFKVAKNKDEVQKKSREAEEQIKDRQYAAQFIGKGKPVLTVAAVVDVNAKHCNMREVDHYPASL